MAGSKLMPLYEQVATRIAGDIESGRFAPGERIYTIREICEHFSVADVTAKGALRRLRERGLIRTVNGAGAFVLDKDEPTTAEAEPVKSVALVKIKWQPTTIFATEIDLIQHELFQMNLPMTYTVASLDDSRDQQRLVHQLDQMNAGCLIVFPTHGDDFSQVPYMPVLRHLGIPLLVIESRSKRDSYVTNNTERATRDLADYLYDEGHRKICLATSFARKAGGFREAISRWSEPVETWILSEPGKTDKDAHDLANQISALSPRPTAVIASDDHAAAVMIGTFTAMGIRVPQDMSVVTFDDHPREGRMSPVPVTVMRHPYVEIAQEVARWAQDRLTGNDDRRIRRELTGTLITRDSSGPAPDETRKRV